MKILQSHSVWFATCLHEQDRYKSRIASGNQTSAVRTESWHVQPVICSPLGKRFVVILDIRNVPINYWIYERCLHAVRNPTATFIHVVFQQGKQWAMPHGHHLKKTWEYFASRAVDVGHVLSVPTISPTIRDRGKVKRVIQEKFQKIFVSKYKCFVPKAPFFDHDPQLCCCL